MDQPLQDRIRVAPRRPGVYLWKDRQGSPLYIGKAKNLRARLGSYMVPAGQRIGKIDRLYREAVELDWIETGSEVEALILEDRLIKQHRPRYNVRLRDDKTYPYLKLHVQDPFPWLAVTRDVRSDGAEYYGPYVSARGLRTTLRVLQRHFRIRQCRGPLNSGHRPCVNHQIGICQAPCAGRITRDVYRRRVREVRLFLRGRSQDLITELTRRMEHHAAEQEFEEAARLRDQIQAVQTVTRGHRAITSGGEDQDVLGIAWRGEQGLLEVFHIRRGALAGRTKLRGEGHQGEQAETVRDLLVRYYGKDIMVPPRILLPSSPSDADLLSRWLSRKAGRKVRLLVPRRGRGRELVELAHRSAGLHLDRARESRDPTEELAHIPGLRRRPEWIEGFDVAHIGGALTVASLVCFQRGSPVRSRYRRYRLRATGGGDDYSAMYEVLARRMARAGDAGWDLPDLLLIDGGRGQLNAALRALEPLGEQRPDIVALAKMRGDRDREGLFVAGCSGEVQLPPDSGALRALQRVRDEAHRFANAYHRQLRSRRLTRSILDEVPGVGRKRKQALLRAFGSLARVRAADVNEIRQVPGIDLATARAIRALLDYADPVVPEASPTSNRARRGKNQQT